MIEKKSYPLFSDCEYENWAESQDWYQAIKLRNGYVTKGNEFEGIRGKLLSNIDFNGKRVLDVGCNSGKYALLAKARGALEVIGVDVDKNRLEQARTLAVNENLDIKFLNMGVEDITELGSLMLLYALLF